MPQNKLVNRRTLMASLGASAIASWTALITRGWAQAAPRGEKKEEEQPVSAVEDLMREHGIVRRIMLIYDHAHYQLVSAGQLPPEKLKDASGIVRQFIEEYHEKLEEEHIFPLFRGGPHADLAKTLKTQHEAGRKITQFITENATAEAIANESQRYALAKQLNAFNKMYRPHAAREDTVLFPALHKALKPAQYDKMGDAFEEREKQLFGEGGFEKMVDRVADIEKALGIYDIEQFTPQT